MIQTMVKLFKPNEFTRNIVRMLHILMQFFTAKFERNETASAADVTTIEAICVYGKFAWKHLLLSPKDFDRPCEFT